MPTIVWALEGQDASLTETLRRVGTLSDEMGTKGSAAWLKLQAAQATFATSVERISAQMGHYLDIQDQAAEGSKRFEAAEQRLIGLDAQEEAARQRLTAAEEQYAQATLKAAQQAEEAAAREAAAVEAAAAKEAAAQEKATQQALFAQDKLRTAVIAAALEEAAAVEASAAKQAAAEEKAMQQAIFAHDKLLTSVEVAAQKEAAAMEASLAKQQGAFGSMISSAAENVLVYGTLYSMYGKLTQGVTDFTKALFDNAAANEKFVAFANASVGGGSARLQELLQQSTSVAGGGLPLKDLEALDQRLQLLGVTAENTQQRFGRSIGQVRADLITLSQLPSMDSTKALEFFSRAEDGAQRLVASLLTAGLTSRTELEAMGVTFKGATSTITSDTKTNTEALLRLVEEKWGTLSQVNANTWDGVTERIRNFAEEATGILGKDITGQFERNWGHLLDTVSSPQGVAALQRWGEGLGQFVSTLTKVNEALTDTIFHMYDTQSLITGQPSHLADAYQAWLKHNAALDAAAAATAAASAAAGANSAALNSEGAAADSTAASITRLTAALQDARDTSAEYADAEKTALAPLQAREEAARTAQAAADALAAKATAGLQDQLAGQQEVIKGYQRQQAAADSLAAATTQGLQDQMAAQQAVIKGIQGQQQATDAAATAQVTGLQSHMQALQDQSTALGEKYAALIQPWKDLETQQNRVYENQQRATRLGDLNARIGTDTVLAKDVFSSEGRAAATRLMSEKEQAGQLGAEIGHAAQIQNDQDHITALERAQKVAQDGIKDQETATQRQIQGVEAARKASDARYQAAIAAEQTLVDRTQDQLKITERARQTADADYRASIAAEQTLVDQTQDRLKAVEAARKTADALTKTELDADAARIKLIQDAYSRVQEGITATEHALDRQIHAAQEGAKTESVNVLDTINTAVARVTSTVTGMANALKALGISTGTGPEYHNTGPGPAHVDATAGAHAGTPTWADTAVSGAHYEGEPGPPDQGRPTWWTWDLGAWRTTLQKPATGAGAGSSPQYHGTGSSGPQGMAPGSQGLHVTIGFDDSLKPHVVKVIQNELRQPGNGSNLSAGLSWAGG